MRNRLLWLVFMVSLFSPAEAKPQLRWCLGTFPGFYGFNAQTKQPEGLSVSYLQEIARRANFTLIASQETPAFRCVAQMKTGEADLMINILKPQQGNPAINYIQFGARLPEKVYYANSKNLRLDHPGQLATMTLVTIRTYKAAPELQMVLDTMKKRQLVQVDSVLTALQMVAKQRIDAALLTPTQVQAVLKDHPELAKQLKETSFSTELVKPEAVYIGLSSRCNCPELEVAIKQSIQTMKDDGTSQKIFAGKILVDF
ncbi:substrate-binding periplasmic protein [Rheinheimera sediminis]|uniref:substrate-binding periplasmic protein n=1 Tax=Rheinheimera sp. YQF-1 TaxID=2499626 RepID=UPI0016477F3A|nr:transporter substrate-binding domain-containing protein [Rheinheimera sp. YQF-1]